REERLRENFSNRYCIVEFEVVVHPKRKANKWTTNIEKASLVGLKDYIRKMYQPPALENDGAELNLMNDGKKYFPYNDQDLREMLRIFVSKNNLKFTVFIETPSKAFSDWSFPKVCQLYGLGESDDPSLSVFPPFTCEYKDLEEDSSRAILKHLIAELEARLKSIPINGNEASKSQYVCSYLVSGVNLYEGKFELRPEKNITGPNGHGPVDFAIDLLRTMKTVGVTEVKDEDIFKGIAQNAVQLESALSNRKRKASEMEEDSLFVGKTFGIITDAKEWYFMECSLDDQDKLAFRLSKPVTVVYDSKNMGENVERVLGHIAWLLEE
ncbi:37261_t:CDS:1, partial [Gigaspora margarita]